MYYEHNKTDMYFTFQPFFKPIRRRKMKFVKNAEPPPNSIKRYSVALHTGPVFTLSDPIACELDLTQHHIELTTCIFFSCTSFNRLCHRLEID